MDLFGQDLLDAETHKAVFGELPTSLQRELRTPAVGDLVLQLLDAGWRRGQLAARIGAMPVGLDPVADVSALLRGFLEQLPPDARWREEKAHRQQVWEAARAQQEEPASEESRRQWMAQIRADLAVVTPARRSQPRRPVRPCAMCGQEGEYFVTRGLRLCASCVELLQSGAVRVTESGAPGGQLAG